MCKSQEMLKTLQESGVDEFNKQYPLTEGVGLAIFATVTGLVALSALYVKVEEEMDKKRLTDFNRHGNWINESVVNSAKELKIYDGSQSMITDISVIVNKYSKLCLEQINDLIKYLKDVYTKRDANTSMTEFVKTLTPTNRATEKEFEIKTNKMLTDVKKSFSKLTEAKTLLTKKGLVDCDKNTVKAIITKYNDIADMENDYFNPDDDFYSIFVDKDMPAEWQNIAEEDGNYHLYSSDIEKTLNHIDKCLGILERMYTSIIFGLIKIRIK